MKLAEALIIRADHQKKFEQLKQRLLLNAKVQDDDEPAEDPAKLLKEIEEVSETLNELIRRINATNSVTRLTADMTISDAIARRDILQMKHALYRDLANSAVIKQDRYTKSEIKFRSTVNVAQLQKKADSMAKEHRELDSRIQEANWKTDLTG